MKLISGARHARTSHGSRGARGGRFSADPSPSRRLVSAAEGGRARPPCSVAGVDARRKRLSALALARAVGGLSSSPSTLSASCSSWRSSGSGPASARWLASADLRRSRFRSGCGSGSGCVGLVGFEPSCASCRQSDRTVVHSHARVDVCCVYIPSPEQSRPTCQRYRAAPRLVSVVTPALATYETSARTWTKMSRPKSPLKYWSVRVLDLSGPR